MVTAATAVTTIGGIRGGWTRRLNPNQIELCKKFTRDQIELAENVIMEGTYSRIQEARLLVECATEDTGDDEAATNEANSSKTTATTAKTLTTTTRVMVKMVTERASKEQSQRMLIESAMLRGLKHKNICAVLGVYLVGDDENNDDCMARPMSVFPYFETGNMKTFLSDIRERVLNSSSRQKTDQLDEDVIISKIFLFFYIFLFQIILIILKTCILLSRQLRCRKYSLWFFSSSKVSIICTQGTSFTEI